MFKDINSEMAIKVWTLKTGEVGESFLLDKQYAESVMVKGTFGKADVIFEGTNDIGQDTDYCMLTDNHGQLLMFGSSGLRSISEECVSVRPRVEGGDNTTEVTVTLLVEK
jgi:hypothetical protein